MAPDQQRVTDILAVLDEIRAQLTPGDLSDGLVLDLVLDTLSAVVQSIVEHELPEL